MLTRIALAYVATGIAFAPTVMVCVVTRIFAPLRISMSSMGREVDRVALFYQRAISSALI